MKKITPLLIISFFLVISCNNDTSEKENTQEETKTVIPVPDNPNAEITAADTSSTGVYQEEVVESETNEGGLKEALQATTTEVVEEESGLSFCDCVKKQKKLENIMLETEDDAVFDKAMEDIEALKTGDCKILFASKQNTLDDKQAHEQRVKNCLGH